MSAPRPASPEYLAFSGVTVDLAVRIDHLPQPGERLAMVPLGEHDGGMAANAACAFAALGGRAGVASTVGDDANGRRALADLARRGVDTTWIHVVDEPTLWTMSLLTPGDDRTILEFPMPRPAAKFERFDPTALEGVRFVHVGASEGPAALPLLEAARRRGITVALDVESLGDELEGLAELLALADVAFVNARAARAFGASPDEALAALHRAGPRTVVLTRGAEGCVLGDVDGGVVAIPVRRVEAVDPTGAGDCFAGAFAFGRTRGWPDEETCQLANLMAAVSTTAMGSRGRLATPRELGALAREDGLAVAGKLP